MSSHYHDDSTCIESYPQANPAECTAECASDYVSQPSSRVGGKSQPIKDAGVVEINNQIMQLTHDLTEDIPVKLDEEEKVEYDARVKSHNKKMDDLKLH